MKRALLLFLGTWISLVFFGGKMTHSKWSDQRSRSTLAYNRFAGPKKKTPDVTKTIIFPPPPLLLYFMGQFLLAGKIAGTLELFPHSASGEISLINGNGLMVQIICRFFGGKIARLPRMPNSRSLGRF